MNIVFGVACITALFRIAVFFIGLVTAITFHQAVFPIQQKIGVLMIEYILVQPDYLGVAALVFAMTGFAFEIDCIGIFTMEPLLVTDVFSYRRMIMAIKA